MEGFRIFMVLFSIFIDFFWSAECSWGGGEEQGLPLGIQQRKGAPEASNQILLGVADS